MPAPSARANLNGLLEVHPFSGEISPTLPMDADGDVTVVLQAPGSLADFASCKPFIDLLNNMKSIDFEHSKSCVGVHILHHKLPGALSLSCSEANYEELLGAIRPTIRDDEVISTTLLLTNTSKCPIPPKCSTSTMLQQPKRRNVQLQ